MTQYYIIFFQVLEVLLESCTAVINIKGEDLENRLQGMEKVAKATILGHLVPPLMTSMTHVNLRCLSMADSLMTRLVHLVVLSSQVELWCFVIISVIPHDFISLTHYQTTNFRLFKTERVCRRQFQI